MTVELPVKADPGATPMLPPAVPLIVVGPVLVIVVAPKTAKLVVVPWVIVSPAADVDAGYRNMARSGRVPIAANKRTFCPFFIMIRFCFVFGIRHRGSMFLS